MMAQHEKEIEKMAERLENEKSRQLMAVRNKMAKRRMQKLDDLRRRHDVDVTKEMLGQKKELDEIRLKVSEKNN